MTGRKTNWRGYTTESLSIPNFRRTVWLRDWKMHRAGYTGECRATSACFGRFADATVSKCCGDSVRRKGCSMAEEKLPWPALPKALQHRVSLKWTTIESLRILVGRKAANGEIYRVLLLTGMGPIQGELADLADTYEDSVDPQHGSSLDIASATAHLRTDVWNMYASQDDNLEPSDVAPVIRLRNVTIRAGAKRLRLPELAVFASDVIGYTCITTDLL